MINYQELEAILNSLPIEEIEQLYSYIGFYLIDINIVQETNNEKPHWTL